MVYSMFMQALGNFIGGQFVPPTGKALVSRNPAADGAVVFETGYTVEAVHDAAGAAAAAQPAWRARSLSERWEHLSRFKQAIAARADALADAIVWETGKIRSEAKAEISTLLNRFDLVRAAMASDQKSGPVAPGETLRYAPLGVVGVIGPFNFPLHLCHAHVIPALAAGNTVVVKPSDITPLCGQRYSEAAAAAQLPPGTLNVVAGTGEVGAAMVRAPQLHGLCFTGSWAVGQKILAAAVDRPELLIALEMGGKNMCVVLDDCALRQAVHEVVIGGYISAGQRCTATDRVLVHRKIADAFIAALADCVRSLKFGSPEDPAVFAGPLSTMAAAAKVDACLGVAERAGAEVVVPSRALPGGAFRTASLYRLPGGVHEVPGYTDVELFGPNLCVEVVEDDDEAIAILAASPFGFVNSVFTQSRFEPFFARTRSGMLNRNRSTNFASPKLPFGGVGTSGNYRPAGAWAHRNVTYPVAVLDNAFGAVTPHAQLAAHLPGVDLDRLEVQHKAEESAEAARSLLDRPRPMALLRPAGGSLPGSEAWLQRLYAGDRVAKDKKPLVFDHLRSAGPWMVSVDAEPLSVLDGMSQTATVVGGFAEDAVVRSYTEGEFADTLISNDDTALDDAWAAGEYATALRKLVPGLPHVAFVSSGAEANEKAMALCRMNCDRPAATRVLAFEGSFHGRTLLALHATHSPTKRKPFELAGYECTFAPFPVWDTPHLEQPTAPSGFYAAIAAGEIGPLKDRFGESDLTRAAAKASGAPPEGLGGGASRSRSRSDALLAAEVQALSAVHDALATGTYFCCIVEPMQCEGGDRYATERFFRALRLLTRFHKTLLVFDEVQVGFGLGGPFAWHSKFRLLTPRGQQDAPDAVTFAKRAQVGVVMSRFADPEPASVQCASLVRGRIHAEMVAANRHAERLEKLVAPRLAAIASSYPHLVQFPRSTGYAFAFDLPTSALLDAFLGQRFWRGAVVFGAGTRTARYRLSDSYHSREVDQLFEAIRRSLSWLDAHHGKQPPSWEDDNAAPPELPPPPTLRYRQVPREEATAYLQQIIDMESQVYALTHRTPVAEIRAATADREGSLVICEAQVSSQTVGEGPSGSATSTVSTSPDSWKLVGVAVGGALESHRDVDGCSADPMLGRRNTLYSAAITVASDYRGMGVGRRLKELQLRDAASRKTETGESRYRYVSGRNRIGRSASALTHKNRAFGAHVVQVMTGQHADPEGQAMYYRIPLGPYQPDPDAKRESCARRVSSGNFRLDLASGLSKPFATGPDSLVAAEAHGALFGPAVNKITLMNYATPAAIRAIEWVSSLVPELPHVYITSSRDESVDKALRLLRFSRKSASVAIGIAGGYYGHTIATTRSLSDPETHRGGPVHFSWPRIPHPAVAGTAESIRALRSAIEAAGRDNVIGFVYELVQERTGWVLPADFLAELATLRSELDLPLIAVETTTHSYRSGKGAFLSPATGVMPDVLTWWGGGQTGYLHVAARWFVSAPLTLISTWDGDELSLVRQHHQLRAARQLDIATASAALERSLSAYNSFGLGGYRVIDPGGDPAAVALALELRGIRVRRFPNGRIGIIPALDQIAAAAAALAASEMKP